MSDPVETFPALSLDLGEPAGPLASSAKAAEHAKKWQREYEAFRVLLPELMQTHLGLRRHP